jgi:hypothetical protein
MSTEPTDNSQVTFVQYQQPGLKDGIYTISASISASGPPPPQPFFSPQKVLQVGGGPAVLPAGALQSVFPPEDSSGDYTGSLPHVVLDSKTFPWQRFAIDSQPNTPWLAVLLLTDDEYTAQTKATPSTDTILNLDSAFFASIAPSLDDLQYLAHVRTVDTVNKSDSTVTEGQYSVVIGNRLPQPGTKSRAFLVSLEEMGGTLPQGSTNPVALTILYAWRFFTIEEPRDFTDVVAGLNAAPLTLPPPALSSTPSASDTAVANSLAMGYKPVLHTLRVGGQTVSWYRGPFAPYAVTRTVNVPINSSDAVCFYDPTTGMMDASCSAAFELGRLMALHNGSFATGLYNWKRVTQRDTIDRLEYELTTGQPAPSGVVSQAVRQARETNLAASLSTGLAGLGGIKPVAAQAPNGHAAAAPARVAAPALAAKAPHTAMRQALRDPARVAAVQSARIANLAAPSSAPDSADQLWAWMGDLALLKGVPFHYLVPDPSMLPTESIRFFQVDTSWLDALLDGAFSLGRSTEADQANDQAFLAAVRTRAYFHAATARRRRRGVKMADPTPDAPTLLRPASGFLMRSMAVTQWPGLEVLAGGPNGPATILRMEKMQTILFCLFDQPIETVIIQQPSEGLHFGLENHDGTLIKYPRVLVQVQGGPLIGSLMQTPIGAIPYRASSSSVLDIATLAGQLNTDSQNPAGSPFTSAEFALEMILGVGRVTFNVGS